MFTLPSNQLIEMGTVLQQVGRFIPRTERTGMSTEGQCSEVPLIRRLLGEGCPPATYVDVGAGDPESCSNTWAFYLDGWSGLLIEPMPFCWYRLLRMRPRDYLAPYAASNIDGFGRLRVCGASSSMRPDWGIQEQAEIMVETFTLRTILKNYPQILRTCRLCSIDVEGLERQVLEGIDWQTFHPDVFVIEFVKFDAERVGADISAEWEPLILAQNYRLVGQTPLNRIYQRQG